MDRNTAIPIIFLFSYLVLVSTIITVNHLKNQRRALKRREQHLAAIAATLGWHYHPRAELNQVTFIKLCRDFRIFSEAAGTIQHLEHVMCGRVQGYPAKIFDTPPNRPHHTILMIELSCPIPRLNLHPRTWLDRLAEDGRGLMAASFTLHSDDYGWVNRHFSPGVVQYYAASPQINIEAKGSRILFYYADPYSSGQFLPAQKENFTDLLAEARTFINVFAL